MKLVTFKKNNQIKVGSLLVPEKEQESLILDLDLAHQQLHGTSNPIYHSMQNLIDSGKPGLEQARQLEQAEPKGAVVQYDEVKLLSPLPTPIQMRDFLCFETHMAQAGASVAKLKAKADGDEKLISELKDVTTMPIPPIWYQQPIYYKCNRFAVAAPNDDIIWPHYSRVMDYELEFAVVIGKKGIDITKENARDHIFGYTIFNDFSARDAQSKEMSGPLGPAKGKDFDGANILGPCIVTADEIDDPYNLTMTARVNDEIWTQENSGSIHWTFEQMIEFVSQGETLYPGEVLGSGTVGNGCGLEHMKFLKHGDVVELEISQIGKIRNKVVAPHTV